MTPTETHQRSLGLMHRLAEHSKQVDTWCIARRNTKVAREALLLAMEGRTLAQELLMLLMDTQIEASELLLLHMVEPPDNTQQALH